MLRAKLVFRGKFWASGVHTDIREEEKGGADELELGELTKNRHKKKEAGTEEQSHGRGQRQTRKHHVMRAGDGETPTS